MKFLDLLYYKKYLKPDLMSKFITILGDTHLMKSLVKYLLVLKYFNSLRVMRRLLTNKYEETIEFLQVRVLEVDVVAL